MSSGIFCSRNLTEIWYLSKTKRYDSILVEITMVVIIIEKSGELYVKDWNLR